MPPAGVLVQRVDNELSAVVARRVRAKAWRCWRNAAMAVGHLGSYAAYVEGWVVTDPSDPFVIEHGWCEVDARIVDPSYAPRVNPYGPPVAYFAGLRFTAKQVAAALARRQLPLAWTFENAPYRKAFAAAWRYAAQGQESHPSPPTRVVNCRHADCDVFIGRPSRWAGPFFLGRDGGREDIIAKYRRWIVRQPGLLHDVWSLRGKVLGCDCAPLPCHGDVLAELADFNRDSVATETPAMDRAVAHDAEATDDDLDVWPAVRWGGDRTGNSSHGR